MSDHEEPQVRGPRKRRSRATRTPLTLDRIVTVAIELADEEGPDALSMRRVAAKLGTGAMSLYSYVQNKDDLVDAVADSLFREIAVPEASGDWRADLTEISRKSRAMFLRHPWIFAALNTRRPTLGPGLVQHIEESVRALDGMDLDIGTIACIIGTVDNYVLGSTIDEIHEVEMKRRWGVSHQDWRSSLSDRIAEISASGEYPRFVRLLGAPELAPDDKFEIGLECVLDGAAALIERARTERTG